MKKLHLFASMLMAGVLLVSGCGSASKLSDEYIGGIKASKYVTLGEYKGIALEENYTPVTDEYVDSYIEYLLMMNTSTKEVDRAAKVGDMVNIDYKGTLDGVAFDRGSAEDYDLYLGSGTFIPGFEDGLIGYSAGDEVDLNLTFPENYGNEDLAGKETVFHVIVNSVNEEVETKLDDSFAKDQGYDSVDVMKTSVKDMLTEEAETSFNTAVENDVVDKIYSNCEFKEPPAKMVARYTETLMDNLKTYAAAYGMEMDAFMQTYYGMDTETYPAELENQAKETAKQFIMMKAIADKEGISISDEELDAELVTAAENAGYGLEEYKELIDPEGYREYMLSQKVLKFLVENANVTRVSEDSAE